MAFSLHGNHATIVDITGKCNIRIQTLYTCVDSLHHHPNFGSQDITDTIIKCSMGSVRYKIRLVVFHVYMMVTFSTERYVLNHVHFSVFLLITTVESGNILPTKMASIMDE